MLALVFAAASVVRMAAEAMRVLQDDLMNISVVRCADGGKPYLSF